MCLFWAWWYVVSCSIPSRNYLQNNILENIMVHPFGGSCRSCSCKWCQFGDELLFSLRMAGWLLNQHFDTHVLRICSQISHLLDVEVSWNFPHDYWNPPYDSSYFWKPIILPVIFDHLRIEFQWYLRSVLLGYFQSLRIPSARSDPKRRGQGPWAAVGGRGRPWGLGSCDTARHICGRSKSQPFLGKLGMFIYVYWFATWSYQKSRGNSSYLITCQ